MKNKLIRLYLIIMLISIVICVSACKKKQKNANTEITVTVETETDITTERLTLGSIYDDGPDEIVDNNNYDATGDVENYEDYVHYDFRKEAYLEEHFEKHGDEFEYATKEQYLEGANNVINSPDALTKNEKEDGDYIYYLENTNEFVIVSTDGYIRTYFKPSDGINYYNRQ